MPKKRAYLAANERRQRILEAARGLIAERGCLVTEELCRVAEISRATLYHYFGGPEAVRVALLEQLAARIDELLDQRPTLVAGSLPLRPTPELIEAAVRASLGAMFSLVFAHREAVAAALRSRNTDAGADALLRRMERAMIGALEEDLRAAKQAGLVDVIDPHLSALCLFAGLRGLVEHGLFSDRAVDVGELVETALRIQLHGILVQT